MRPQSFQFCNKPIKCEKDNNMTMNDINLLRFSGYDGDNKKRFKRRQCRKGKKEHSMFHIK